MTGRFWRTTRGMVLFWSLGAVAGSAGMFMIGFQIGNRAKFDGSWRQRIVGPARTVIPVPPPLGVPGCVPGDEPPPLPSTDWLRGEARTWDDFKGQVVIVDVWANWCPYCQVMASDIKAIGERYEAKGVVVLSITPDNRSTADAYCTNHRLSGPVLCDAEPFLKTWLADTYPMLVVIGRDGRVIWNDGGARLHHRIDELAKTLCDVLDRGC
ncbi:MAG TPA: TlpA disulfide reductase family protein [Pirellulales bacterium]|nr:TlpA disulfide reductase family protein [Pirellulales bacterium]